MDAEPLGEETRGRLRDLRGGLLRLHKLLLDAERAAYEREHGRAAAGEMLQLVINDARFAWLRRISELIVTVDEMLAAKGEPATEAEARAALSQARALVSPAADDATDFAEKYRAALQRDPSVVMAHAEVARALAAED